MTELINKFMEVMVLQLEVIIALIMLNLLIAPYYFIYRFISKRLRNKRIKRQFQQYEYNNGYKAKTLLTTNEWNNYKKLKKYSDKKGLLICPKVRLLDLVEPKDNATNYTDLINKIHAKHVDFVICDQEMNIKAIIELDDSSHDTLKAQETDTFKNLVLQSVGYKIIRTRLITATTLDVIDEKDSAPCVAQV